MCKINEPSIRSLEDNSAESNVDYRCSPKEVLGGTILATGAEPILVIVWGGEKADAFCTHPKNFHEVKLKSGEVVSLVEEMSRQTY